MSGGCSSGNRLWRHAWLVIADVAGDWRWFDDFIATGVIPDCPVCLMETKLANCFKIGVLDSVVSFWPGWEKEFSGENSGDHAVAGLYFIMSFILLLVIFLTLDGVVR